MCVSGHTCRTRHETKPPQLGDVYGIEIDASAVPKNHNVKAQAIATSHPLTLVFVLPPI